MKDEPPRLGAVSLTKFGIVEDLVQSRTDWLVLTGSFCMLAASSRSLHANGSDTPISEANPKTRQSHSTRAKTLTIPKEIGSLGRQPNRRTRV